MGQVTQVFSPFKFGDGQTKSDYRIQTLTKTKIAGRRQCDRKPATGNRDRKQLNRLIQ